MKSMSVSHEFVVVNYYYGENRIQKGEVLGVSLPIREDKEPPLSVRSNHFGFRFVHHRSPVCSLHYS